MPIWIIHGLAPHLPLPLRNLIGVGASHNRDRSASGADEAAGVRDEDPTDAMNLRLRLNLMIAGALALTLLLGVTLVIRNAQQAVDKELRAAAELTSQLLQAALSGPDQSASTARYRHLFEHIAALKTTRHLDLELRTNDGIVRVKQESSDSHERPDAPDWSVRLVAPSPMEYAHSFTLADNEVGRIALRADPTDEITEAWKEARDMLAVLLVFYVTANALVFFTIGRGLRPIGTILAALDGVERGDYRQRLPMFALPELSRISKHFNRMTERLEQGLEQNRLLTQRSLPYRKRNGAAWRASCTTNLDSA